MRSSHSQRVASGIEPEKLANKIRVVAARQSNGSSNFVGNSCFKISSTDDRSMSLRFHEGLNDFGDDELIIATVVCE